MLKVMNKFYMKLDHMSDGEKIEFLKGLNLHKLHKFVNDLNG